MLFFTSVWIKAAAKWINVNVACSLLFGNPFKGFLHRSFGCKIQFGLTLITCFLKGPISLILNTTVNSIASKRPTKTLFSKCFDFNSLLVLSHSTFVDRSKTLRRKMICGPWLKHLRSTTWFITLICSSTSERLECGSYTVTNPRLTHSHCGSHRVEP